MAGAFSPATPLLLGAHPMADVFSRAKRAEVMSRISGQNTAPERAVRSMLHGMGYRFRLHRADLPGKPDIVLPRYRTVILVHGCFWHRHKGCKFAYTPKSRVAFWCRKFESNVARDRRVVRDLRCLGWRVVTVWECELRAAERLCHRLRKVLDRGHLGC